MLAQHLVVETSAVDRALVPDGLTHQLVAVVHSLRVGVVEKLELVLEELEVGHFLENSPSLASEHSFRGMKCGCNCRLLLVAAVFEHYLGVLCEVECLGCRV